MFARKTWGIGAGLLSAIALGGACSGSNALEPYQRISVAVVGSGEGQGYVYANDPAVDIECLVNQESSENNCQDTFSDAGEGGVFSLIAVPIEGSVFAGWSWSTGETGCSEVNGTQCLISFTETGGSVSIRVTARFEPISEGAG